MDRFKEYVEKAKNEGKQTFRKHANGLDYIFIKELDGWYSIIDATGGEYRPVIQAKDVEHAESYIAMIEPLNVPVQFI